jgi:hypothetical protein
MSAPNQDNLWSVSKMKQFYDSNKAAIDNAFLEIITKKTPTYEGNYVGMLEAGKPHTLKKYEQFIDIARKVYEVLEKYKNKPEIVKLRKTHPALEALVYAFIYIESKCDHRANLKAPSPRSSAKGLVQIISGKNASSYPDFSGKSANFNSISTTTPYHREPVNSIYNATNSIERVLVFLSKNDKIIKETAGNISPQNRKYPVSGWALYCYWNQGITGGRELLNIYLKNPNTKIKDLKKGFQRNINANTFDGGKPDTVGEWFEKLRLQYNIGYYLLCNNCIPRYFKKRIERNSNQKVAGSEILKTNLTCTPLNQNEFKIPIGAFVRLPFND